MPKYGFQILPYEGGAVLQQDGGYLAMYRDHDANRREFARHSKRDAEAYDRYSAISCATAASFARFSCAPRPIPHHSASRSFRN